MQLRVMEREHNPVERARSGADLLAVLLEASREEAGQGTAWLASAFKNVMIKQMALVSGAMAGVRNLLGFLAPQKIDAEAREKGMLAYRLLRSRALWRTYVEKHETLSEEDRQAIEAIFSPQLSKTYI